MPSFNVECSQQLLGSPLSEYVSKLNMLYYVVWHAPSMMEDPEGESQAVEEKRREIRMMSDLNEGRL